MNAIDVIIVLLLAVFGIAFWCIYCLFHMLNGAKCTEADIQSTALHLIELLRRQFLGNSRKIINQLFFKSLCGWLLQTNKLYIFLKQCHSNVEKSGGQTIEQSNGKSDLFCMISTTWDEQQKLEIGRQVALFYCKTLQVPGK